MVKIKRLYFVAFLAVILLIIASILITALNAQKGTHTLNELTADTEGNIPVSDSNGNEIIIVDHSTSAAYYNFPINTKSIGASYSDQNKIYWSQGNNGICIDKSREPGAGKYCKSFVLNPS